MIKSENNQLVLVFDKCYSSYEEIFELINSILSCLGQTSADFYNQEQQYYLCELVRMMLPDPDQFSYGNVSAHS